MHHVPLLSCGVPQLHVNLLSFTRGAIGTRWFVNLSETMTQWTNWVFAALLTFTWYRQLRNTLIVLCCYVVLHKIHVLHSKQPTVYVQCIFCIAEYIVTSYKMLWGSQQALKYWTHFDQSEHLAHLKHEHFAFFFLHIFQVLRKLVLTLKKCFLAQKHI